MDDANANSKPYKPGGSVYHPIFGQGKVLGFEQSSSGDRVRISFDELGEKWLMLKYANLLPGHCEPGTIDCQQGALKPLTPGLPASPRETNSSGRGLSHKTATVNTDTPISRRRLFKSLAGLAAAIPALGVGVAIGKPAGRPLKVLESRIAGFAHYEGENFHSRIQPGEPLTLRRESGNKYDGQAIEAFWYGRKLGYVPRRHNAALSQLMDNHEVVKARVTEVDYHSPWEPVEFEVEVWV